MTVIVAKKGIPTLQKEQCRSADFEIRYRPCAQTVMDTSYGCNKGVGCGVVSQERGLERLSGNLKAL